MPNGRIEFPRLLSLLYKIISNSIIFQRFFLVDLKISKVKHGIIHVLIKSRYIYSI